MTQPKVGLRAFPHGHPFGNPEGKSPSELASDLLSFHRATFGGFRMEDDPDDDEDEDDDGEPNEVTEVKIGDRVWKVSDLQRIAATEKRQGKAAGQREVLEALGVKNLDEAKRIVEAYNEAQRANETEAERKLREAEERERAANEKDSKADQRVRRADLRGALREAGVARADLDDAFVLLDREVGNEYEDDDLEAAVEALQTRRPALFAAEDDQDDQPPARRAGQLPPGRSGPRPTPKGKKFGAGGLDRAARRFGDKAGK